LASATSSAIAARFAAIAYIIFAPVRRVGSGMLNTSTTASSTGKSMRSFMRQRTAALSSAGSTSGDSTSNS
jgi:hypothetical protein